MAVVDVSGMPHLIAQPDIGLPDWRLSDSSVWKLGWRKRSNGRTHATWRRVGIL